MTELADLIRTELGVEDDSYHATPEAMRVAIRKVLDMHCPYALYTECGHAAEEHEADDIETVYVHDIGWSCEAGRMGQDICKECCTDDFDELGQHRECAEYHGGERGLCYPCPTVRAIAEALGLIAEVDTNG